MLLEVVGLKHHELCSGFEPPVVGVWLFQRQNQQVLAFQSKKWDPVQIE